MTPPPGPFTRLGADCPPGPVILSVPHGGRAYPPEMLPLLRVPCDRLALIEDRHSDTLALAARRDEVALIARHGRAWIDLNRAEADRDPLLEPGGILPARTMSGKVRSGLGLIPRRTAATGDIWRRRLTPAEVAARIHADHRPYHAALAQAVQAAHARFGVAVVVDLHSMPPLEGGAAAPRLVIGDRFGRTAAPRFADAVEQAAAGQGITAARNAPYAGGHVVERHGDPARGIHALQLEIDRSLYLDAALDLPGPGFAATVRLVRAIIAAVGDMARTHSAARSPAIAAE